MKYTKNEDLQLKNEDFEFIDKKINEEEILRPSMTYWQDAWRRLKKNKISLIAILILFIIIGFTLVGPFISNWDYNVINVVNKNQGISKAHWFGTDSLGRDIFTRVWIGGRVSIFIGVVGALIDITIGLIYGGIAGYSSKRVDNIMMRIVELLTGIPYLVVVIIVSLIVGKGIFSLIIAMTLTGWCHMARLVRGQVLQIKSADYILAAEALGTSRFTIIRKHLLPNTLGIMIVAVSFDIPSFIFSEAFLSYIGLGIQSPMTSWGALAAEAQKNMAFYPYQLFFPALMISLTMLSFQLLGDGLRDALDPKLRQ